MINYDFYHITEVVFGVQETVKKWWWHAEIYTTIFVKIILKTWKSIEKTV